VADRAIEAALATGINHFDVAAGFGEAEVRLAERMNELRSRVFLATKTDLRDRDASWQQVGSSLERLQTHLVDLIQVHAIGDLAELDLVTRAEGALEAAVRVRDEGMAGAIGITGHGKDAAATHLGRCRGPRSRPCSPR
jgi:aryl-alcohol dehydrogenase-like predicted oxidoreductase